MDNSAMLNSMTGLLDWKFIVPTGFEPVSPAPKASRIDHYPTGLTRDESSYTF